MTAGRARAAAAVAALMAVLTGCSDSSPSEAQLRAKDAQVPALDHVVVVVLENTSSPTALADPAFAQLVSDGVLLTNYDAVAHNSLPNYLALTSGVTPTTQTEADCPYFNCQVSAPNLAQQLDGAHLRWAAYIGGTDAPCRTPIPGHRDTFTKGYVLHHDPFPYYPSVGATSGGGSPYCHQHLLPLARLNAEAASGTLPRFAFVAPDSCSDGHDRPCRDGRRGGISVAGEWARHEWSVLHSSASWTSRSLFVVTFDEGAGDDHSGCCGDPGGGVVATVLLSAAATAGKGVSGAYDHYSLLRTVEDALGLPDHLGQAAQVQPITGVWKTG